MLTNPPLGAVFHITFGDAHHNRLAICRKLLDYADQEILCLEEDAYEALKKVVRTRNTDVDFIEFTVLDESSMEEFAGSITHLGCTVEERMAKSSTISI